MQSKHLHIFLLLLLATVYNAAAQDAYLISGKISDSVNHQLRNNATVQVKGTTIGTITDDAGNFQLKIPQKLPVELLISAIGYQSQTFVITAAGKEVNILLQPQQMVMDQVVVSASRVSESIMKSPVSIEKLDIRAIKQSAAPSFFDALENLKGVQMTTLSLGYKVPNTRGFSGTTNSRFLQMVDGVDNISPGIGAPIANAVGPTDLDIESVELIPGAASALYGLNAVNGISNMKTKSPFKYEGLSVYQKIGVNHVNDDLHSPTPLSETAIRYAKVIRRFAFKINADYMRGYDWIANNMRDQNPNANVSVGLTGSNNPGSDLVNNYGDESSDRRTLTLNGKKYVVSRTGYAEKDLADYNLHNLKFDASLYYKLGRGSEISYTYRIGNVTNLYQRGNRIELDGLQIQQHVAELKGNNYFLKAYYTGENTGNSYNLRPLGENMDLAFKSNNQWFTDYSNAFLSATDNGMSAADAQAAARASADNGRYQPGTQAFEDKKNQLIHINNWDKGAALIMKTGFVHGEGQYDFSKYVSWVKLLAGFNYRDYIIHPDGNSYVNPESYTDSSKINTVFHYYSYGGFVQGTKTFFDERLKVVASVRADKVQYFDPKINPRIALVYTVSQRHNFRISFQNGYRFPTLFEGFSYVDNGGVKRLGGLEVMSKYFGVFENSYVRTSQDAFIAAVNNDINKNGLSQTAAIEKNENLLVKSNYNYIKPEHINSLEAGYKGVLFGGRLFVDADYYFNVYKDFIGQVELTKPNKGTIGVDDSTAFYAYDKSKSTVYRMWTNSTGVVSNQGASLGLRYNLPKQYALSANVSYSQLLHISEGDALIPAFNTPQWITNISIGNPQFFKNVGFNVSWRWQSGFDWQSPLANGFIPAYDVVDAQINYTVPKIYTTFKLGASNLFNKKYYQYEGGPVIGGLYYFTIIFDNNFQHK